MTGLLAIIALGFFLGMRHATDADHVVAVTTIVTRQRSARQAALIGMVWGVGHTITILVVGSAIILFSLVIPPRLGLGMEFSVGVMLILLGLMNLSGMMRWIQQNIGGAEEEAATHQVHSHPHSHGDLIHSHLHSHVHASGDEGAHTHAAQMEPMAWLDRVFGRTSVYQLLRPFIVGLVHGLAGSAAVALLVLTTIHSPGWAIAYLLVFGVGTIAGMMLITMAIAAPFSLGKESSSMVRGLSVASGLLSVAFGLFVVFHIGFVDGLFTAHPHWTPR